MITNDESAALNTNDSIGFGSGRNTNRLKWLFLIITLLAIAALAWETYFNCHVAKPNPVYYLALS